jgi:hypothetical protein
MIITPLGRGQIQPVTNPAMAVIAVIAVKAPLLVAQMRHQQFYLLRIV